MDSNPVNIDNCRNCGSGVFFQTVHVKKIPGQEYIYPSSPLGFSLVVKNICRPLCWLEHSLEFHSLGFQSYSCIRITIVGVSFVMCHMN